jgi:hypothetical protein
MFSRVITRRLDRKHFTPSAVLVLVSLFPIIPLLASNCCYSPLKRGQRKLCAEEKIIRCEFEADLGQALEDQCFFFNDKTEVKNVVALFLPGWTEKMSFSYFVVLKV